jgi:hypothetical protein
MDEATVRPIVEAHAQAVCDPIDIAHVQADLIEDLHAGLPQLASALPRPVTSASVDSLDVQDDHAIAHITYSGAESSLTIQSRWEDRGAGQPQVVEARPQI